MALHPRLVGLLGLYTGPLDVDALIREGERWRRLRRSRKLTAATLAAAIVLAAIGGTVYAAGGGGRGSTVRTASGGAQIASRAQPRTFVDVLGNQIQLRSSATGKVLRVLRGGHIAGGGSAGAAFSPNGRSVYVSLYSVATKRNVVTQFPTADGSSKVMGLGESPALSTNGHLLATLTGSTGNTVRASDLVTGQARQFDLARLVGKGTSVGGATLAWLGDTSELLLWPQPAGGLGPPVTTAGYGVCHYLATARRYQTNSLCLIALNPFSRHPDPRPVLVPDPKWFLPSLGGDVTLGALMFSGGKAAPDSILIAGTNRSRSRALLVRVRFSASKPAVSPYVSFATSRPAVFAAAGIGLLTLDSSDSHLLYLMTDYRCDHTRCNAVSAPGLWLGAIQDGHLIRTRRLLARTQMTGLTW